MSEVIALVCVFLMGLWLGLLVANIVRDWEGGSHE